MHERLNEAYIAALHGLLHDIGKPVVRLLIGAGRSASVDRLTKALYANALEAGEISEREQNEFTRLVAEVLSSVQREEGYAHEAVWRHLSRLLPVPAEPGISDVLEKAVRIADMESASERLRVPLRAGRLDLVHHTSPFLSPYGLLSILGFTSHDTVKLEIDGTRACIDLRTVGKKCMLTVSASCRKSISSKLGEMSRGRHVDRLAGMPTWHPVKPLRWREDPSSYYADRLEAAKRNVDYESVNASLLSGLYRLLKLIEIASKHGAVIDSVRTLTALYRRSMLFVPSAVYGGEGSIVLPEISLYAHSRVVAAFAAAFTESARLCGDRSLREGCYRLLILDLMNIQRYITMHRTVTAAVRALRGRSLVVELAQRAAANYVLNMLDLPWTNVYTYEGGTVSIIVPCCKQLDSVIRSLEEAFQKEFDGVLGITGGYTREVEAQAAVRRGYSRYVFNPDDPESFTAVLREAQYQLIERKAKVEIEAGRLNAVRPDELEYDPFTEATVPKDRYIPYGSGLDSDYWTSVAGDEGAELIEREGGLSFDSHRALVAGIASLNLMAVIELYPDKTCSEEDVRGLFQTIAERLFNDPRKRYRKISTTGLKMRIALIDFPNLRAGYILVAYDSVDEPDADKLWGAVKTVVQLLAGISRRCRLRVVLTTVNRVEMFLPPPWHAEEIVRFLSSIGPVEIGFDWMAINTRYPVKEDERGGITLRPLDEAVKSGWIALVKMDGDNMGNTMFYMSSSPSRLATASEILAITLGLLGYRLIEKETIVNGEQLGVYVMYMGGDDAVFFGDLPATLKVALSIADLYTRMLPGMTISAGISIEDVKFPLYLSYIDALKMLEKAKSEPIVMTPGDVDDSGRQGTVVVSQMTRPVDICTCNGRKTVNVLKWKGYFSLQKPMEAASDIEACSIMDKLARILVELADRLSDMVREGCPIQGVEAAKVLIAYAYVKAKFAETEPRIDIERLLRELTGIEVSYPPPETVSKVTERLKVQAALLLARNQFNILYQLCRVRPTA